MSGQLSDDEVESWPKEASVSQPESDEDDVELMMRYGDTYAGVDDPDIYSASESDCTSGTNDSIVSNKTSDQRKEDEMDADAIIELFGSVNLDVEAEDCCTSRCNTKIARDVAVRYRQNIQEMDKAQKDIVILTHLQLHCQDAEVDNEFYAAEQDRGRSRRKESDNTNLQMKYYFAGITICRKMYLFLHDCSLKVYSNIRKHFKTQGITPRIHGNANRTPKRENIVTPADIETVVQFIKGYAEHCGFPLPGRLPKWKNFDVVRLPPDVTKDSVYQKYCSTPDVRKMHRTTFLKIWLDYCPYVVITKPANDLCDQNSD